MLALNGVTPERLAEELAGVGGTIGEARKIVAHVLRCAEPDLTRVRQLRRAVRLEALRIGGVPRLALVERRTSRVDPFVKYGLSTTDGLIVEAVRIPLERPGRFSICISSQVGCAMGCSFCATARMPVRRNLETWEIVDQVTHVASDLPAGGRIHGAVFMGMGEPMKNLDAVLEAAAILSHPAGFGVGAPAITISTAGVVPGIRRLTALGRPYRLGVSLTSAIPAKRRSLMPVEATWPLEELIGAARDHARATRRLVMLTYVMLGGVNTGPEDAEALADLVRGEPLFRISLVEYNEWSGQGPGFRPPTAQELAAFRAALADLGVPVVRRYSGGKDVGAACGQLGAGLVS
ncbi:MAG: radical SAM protein [Deltaproteobacteria bacterium]|nr:radical SAM protein [Deltaproteobacteria bacterium]